MSKFNPYFFDPNDKFKTQNFTVIKIRQFVMIEFDFKMN